MDSYSSYFLLCIDLDSALYYYLQPYFIKCWSDEYKNTLITEFVVGSDLCNEAEYIDLREYKELKRISIGDNSYVHVNEVRLEGLSKLETLTIGTNSFNGNNGYFYLKDCPLLSDVQIGVTSFRSFSYSYIENLASLESIVFGSVTEDSRNFYNVREATFQSD